MKLNPQDLAKIASLTLDHYNKRAEDFWQGTRDHDVKQNIAALLQWIEGNPPFTILDFGCGLVRPLPTGMTLFDLDHVERPPDGIFDFMDQRPGPPKSCPVCQVAMQATRTENGITHRCERCDLIITITPLRSGDENKKA